jgi:uncharacterized membrane protein
MAVTPSQLIAPAFVPNAATTAYTSTDAKTRIDYMAFANQSAANVTLTVRLGAVASSPIIVAQTVLPGETYLCPEVVGALLAPGEIIRYECSAASALFGSSNGVQFT